MSVLTSWRQTGQKALLPDNSWSMGTSPRGIWEVRRAVVSDGGGCKPESTDADLSSFETKSDMKNCFIMGGAENRSNKLTVFTTSGVLVSPMSCVDRR